MGAQPLIFPGLTRRAAAATSAVKSETERLSATIAACQRTLDAIRNGRGVGMARSAFPRGEEVVDLGPVSVDLRRHAVRHNGRCTPLTVTEWQLLVFLLSRPDQVVTREQIAAGAWGDGFANRHSEVEVYVSRLRRKLGPASALLQTVRGAGYRMGLPAANGLVAVQAEAETLN